MPAAPGGMPVEAAPVAGGGVVRAALEGGITLAPKAGTPVAALIWWARLGGRLIVVVVIEFSLSDSCREAPVAASTGDSYDAGRTPW